MKPALSYQEKQPPTQWQQFPHGEHILAQINSHLEPWWEKIFGYHLLKVGALSCDVDTSHCPIRHQIHLSQVAETAGVIAEIDNLPFLEHSIDAVLLAHALEFHPDPHHVLREVHRVLRPGGELVLTGFNPLSWFGLAKLLRINKADTPWSGRLFTPARVKDWLGLLGFEIAFEQRFIFSSLSRKGSLTSMPRYQAFCERNAQAIGAVYVLVAHKRLLPLTPIKPRWTSRPKFRPEVKGATLYTDASDPR